ncbi:MAG: autotransporter-associated beta strand repeat-containing protein, partial [Tepidisphaeraceae bacterium]
MRKATFAALAGATALVVGVEIAAADTPLFVTEADFGGSQFAPGGSSPVYNPNLPSPPYYYIGTNSNSVPAGEIKQTNYIGMGYYTSTTTGKAGGTIGPSDSVGDQLTYPATSLGGLNFTKNGLANFDNYNPATGTGETPDANLGTSYAGLTSPTGSLVVNGYTGGYVTVSTGEAIVDYPGTGTESAASVSFINALTSGTCMAYDITAPGGGTTPSTTYYETTFETFDNNGNFNGSGFMQGNLNTSLTNKNINEYGTGSGLTVGNDDPGSFAVAHGTGANSYWTVYLPYSFAANYASTLTYLQFTLELNSGSDQTGNVTIDNIRTVSPTWSASGSGLSWNTAGVVNYNNPDNAPNGTPAHGVLTQAGNWVGGPGGYGVPNGSGVSATFGELETGNASVGLDTAQTLGTLNFNTVQWQYTLTPSSTGSSTSGYLIMDNTANSAPAAINDIAGGQASTNYTEYIAVPVTLNSTTNVTVTRSTDVLDITGNISGTGGLSMSGAGTLQLYGGNTYSGGTTVNSGTLLISTSGALPTNKPVSIAGGLLELASTISGGSGPAATSGVNISSLTIAGNGVLDVNNNHIIITYGSSDPMTSITNYIKSGYNGGGWNGPGIISSAAQTKTNGLSYGVGYADGADGRVSGLVSGQIEVAYTLLGDANLDGLVNAADFTILAANFNQPVTGWDQGDFNYDGLVNAADFTDLAA